MRIRVLTLFNQSLFDFQIFQRTRVFNLVQMVHFLIERFSHYYEKRLLFYSSNRLIRPSHNREISAYNGQEIKKISEDLYEVQSSKKTTVYTVNIATVMCTCIDGGTGKICKHVRYVYEDQNLDASNNYHLGGGRELMYMVATGHPAPFGWLDSLHGGNVIAQTENTGNVSINASPDITDPISRNSSDATDSVEDDVAQLIEAQREFHELLKVHIDEKANNSRQEFIAAYKTASASLRNVTTTNAAVSVLLTVGKYSRAGTRRNFGQIPVKTTALARRKKCLRGRAPGEAGRPRKGVILKNNKHDYSMPIKRKLHSIHNLQYCVDRNICIGQTHSKK